MDSLQLKDRILRFLNKENISSTRFADEIGVQRSSVSHILSGRNKPSFDFIQKILSNYTNLHADWLIMGKGEMYKDQLDTKASSTTLSPLESNIPVQAVPKVENAAPTGSNNNLFSHDSKPEDISKVETEPISSYSKKPDIFTEKKVEPTSNEKQIEKILVFYTDKTFSEYKPE